MEQYDELTYVSRFINRAARAATYFSLKFNGNFSALTRKNRLTQSHVTFIEEASKALEEIYPNRWDIQFGFEPIFKYFKNTYGSNHINTFKTFDKIRLSHIYLVVHWPEITITNSNKQQITIRNLFTRIPVKIEPISGKLRFNTLQGARSTVTPPEFDKGYSHSHLGSSKFNRPLDRCQYKTFCTGDGEINMMTSLLSGYHMPDTDMLRLLLMHLKAYVEWESLEGGPHIQMVNVSNSSTVIPEPNKSDYINTYERFRTHVRARRQFNVDWKLHNGRWLIVDNEKFEQHLRDILYMVTDGKWWLFKDEKGEYYKDSPISREVFEGAKEYLPFRGQKQYFRIEGEFKKAGESARIYLHKKLKDYVKQQLEHTANISKARASLLIK